MENKSPLSHLRFILSKFGLSVDDEKYILSRWTAPHRYWHHLDIHLIPLLNKIEDMKEDLELQEYEAMIMIALFHDIIYDPRSPENEEKSAEQFLRLCATTAHSLLNTIHAAILETKTTISSSSKISKLFNQLDAEILSSKDFDELKEYEHLIFKEYQFVDFDVYREKRIEFLEQWKADHKQNKEMIGQLIAYIHSRIPVIGILEVKEKINPYGPHAENFEKVIYVLPDDIPDDKKRELKKYYYHHQVIDGKIDDIINSLKYPVKRILL